MPGLPGGHSSSGGSARLPTQLSPDCPELWGLRAVTQKHAQDIQEASKRKAPVEELCRLFTFFLAAETKLVQGVEERGGCGMPPGVVKQMKEAHAYASRMGKNVCQRADLEAVKRGLFDVPAASIPGKKWPEGDYAWPNEFHGAPAK
jgi:hypothetical protein